MAAFSSNFMVKKNNLSTETIFSFFVKIHWPFLFFMRSPMSIVASKFTFFLYYFLFISMSIYSPSSPATAEALYLGQAITSTSFRRCRDIAKSTTINY